MSTRTTGDVAEYRDYVRVLLRRRELPTRQVTVMHRDVFARAGVPWNDGQSMEALLSALDKDALIGLARQLRGDDDSDEEDQTP